MTDDSRWMVDTRHVARNYMSDFGASIMLLSRKTQSDYLTPKEKSSIIDFIVELVHEIERLQTENIALNDECDMLQDIANADSANYITPGNWGGYT